MTEIILHTPLWVYAVFAVMLWWGISSRRDRTISLRGVIFPRQSESWQLSFWGWEAVAGP